MCLLDLVLLQTDSQNNCISLVLFHIPSMLALQCDVPNLHLQVMTPTWNIKTNLKGHR